LNAIFVESLHVVLNYSKFAALRESPRRLYGLAFLPSIKLIHPECRVMRKMQMEKMIMMKKK
jgi:hypothetical protein